MANDEIDLPQRAVAGLSGRQRAQRRWVTVEPTVSLFTFGYVSISIIQPFYLQRRLAESLHNITGGDENSGCTGNETDDDTQAIQDDIQSQTSLWMFYLFMSASIPLMISSVVLGTLSDELGRKICLVMPIVGYIIQEVVYLATMHFKLPLPVLFVGSILQGMSGGFGLFYAGCASYIVDITSEKNRTLRLAVIEMVFSLFGGFVQVGIGFMVDYVSILAPFFLALGANILCLLYIAIPGFLFETVDPENIAEDRKGLKEAGRSVVKLFKFNENGRRWQMLLLNAFMFFINLNIVGTSAIFILYGAASPFCWDAISASIASAFRYITVSVGMVGGTKLFELCMGDHWIMQVSCLSLLAFNVVMGVSQTTWMIYLASILGAFELMSVPIARTLLSQIVESTEIGAAFSLVGCLDNLAGFIAGIMGTGIYSATVKSVPPAVFYVFAGLCVFPVGIVVVLQLFWPRNKNDEVSEEEHEECKGSDMGGHTNEGIDESDTI
ncbi:proton-coupled folate transporter-like [Patiria miniata]|uniref:Proton-coupled folate transporter n=1 Tax=Patiria miniata TaxID=46514 RepID=A0A914BMJ7_PATMI|nr:proton-coupled folate transporter-like [Patiria miniata]